MCEVLQQPPSPSPWEFSLDYPHNYHTQERSSHPSRHLDTIRCVDELFPVYIFSISYASLETWTVF
jgi:hypothetical protein